MKRFVSYAAMIACLMLGKCLSGQTTQSQPANFDVAVHWAKGDVFHLEIIRELTQTGKPDGRSRSQVDLAVLETGPNGHVIAWTIRKTEILDPEGKPIKIGDPTAAFLMEAFNNIPIEVELSSACEVAGVRNFEKLQPVIDKSIDTVIGLSKSTEAEKQKLRTVMQSFFHSPQVFVESFTKELSLYFQMSEASLPLDGVLERDSVLSMSLGGGTIPAKIKVKLESLDSTGGVAVVTGSRTLDPKGATEALHQAVKEAAAPMGTTVPAEFPRIDIADTFRYVIDTKNGLPRSVDYKRKAITGDQSKTESYHINRTN